MRIVAISDTHLRHSIAIPDGDILIHAGDACIYGNSDELKNFGRWYSALPHKYKIYVAGNHDKILQYNPLKAKKLLPNNIIYLQDNFVDMNGIKIYGSPWQPWFYDWAFNLSRGPEIKAKWDLIPNDTDVLITHGPPYGACDLLIDGSRVGCYDLLNRIKELNIKYHICGHIHYGYGESKIGNTTIINAAICDESYWPLNKPIVFDY
jgi:Icc-related predicted phosphoesterase